MKRFITCLIFGLGFACSPLRADSGLVSSAFFTSKPELLARLRTDYVDFDKIESRSGDLQGMIAASRGSLSVAPAETPAATMYATLLPGNVIYWRAGSFIPATTWQDITAEANSAARNSPGLILDLRNNSTPDDFTGALRIARFLSKGKPGLNFRQDAFHAAAYSADPMLQGQTALLVLTNAGTRGAAEILAASLQARGALVIGGATEGRAAIFSELPLKSGTVLRYATAHVYLANGTDLWNHPVMPDVMTRASASDDARALAFIDRAQVAAVIRENAVRHRMSEAALVAGTDPEQDALIASREQALAMPQAPGTRDVDLLDAMASLEAIHVLQGEAAPQQLKTADTGTFASAGIIASTGTGR